MKSNGSLAEAAKAAGAEVTEAKITYLLYDYENQAWVKDGKYIRCGHSPDFDCQCFGKIHEGETPKSLNWIK